MVKTKCKTCGHTIEQDGPRSMKRCKCGIKWHFTIVDNKPYLFQCKLPSVSEDDRKRDRHVSASNRQVRELNELGYSQTDAFNAGYNLLVHKKTGS